MEEEEEEVAEIVLRVGASATDDASTNRLVKQLFGASIRCRVSGRVFSSARNVSQRENLSRSGSSFDEKVQKKVLTIHWKCSVYMNVSNR